MIAICKHTTGECLPNGIQSISGWSKEMTFPGLTISSLYIVYGISTINGYQWYLVCEDGFKEDKFVYPTYLPSQLFEIVCSKHSKYWISKEAIDDYTGERIMNIGIPEMVSEKYFLGNLLEDYEREVNLFMEYKKLIDSEVVELLKKCQ